MNSGVSGAAAAGCGSFLHFVSHCGVSAFCVPAAWGSPPRRPFPSTCSFWLVPVKTSARATVEFTTTAATQTHPTDTHTNTHPVSDTPLGSCVRKPWGKEKHSSSNKQGPQTVMVCVVKLLSHRCNSFRQQGFIRSSAATSVTTPTWFQNFRNDQFQL